MGNRELQIIGRRIGAALMAVVGGLLMYFDEGIGFAIGWVVMIAVVYAALLRWVPVR